VAVAVATFGGIEEKTVGSVDEGIEEHAVDSVGFVDEEIEEHAVDSVGFVDEDIEEHAVDSVGFVVEGIVERTVDPVGFASVDRSAGTDNKEAADISEVIENGWAEADNTD
jgi:hypothetical protein